MLIKIDHKQIILLFPTIFNNFKQNFIKKIEYFLINKNRNVENKSSL